MSRKPAWIARMKDIETRAIAEIMFALSEFDNETQIRILNYVNERLSANAMPEIGALGDAPEESQEA